MSAPQRLDFFDSLHAAVALALRVHPHRAGDMKVTIEACRELISLPMYPQLTAEQVEYVAAQVLDFVSS